MISKYQNKRSCDEAIIDQMFRARELTANEPAQIPSKNASILERKVSGGSALQMLQQSICKVLSSNTTQKMDFKNAKTSNPMELNPK